MSIGYCPECGTKLATSAGACPYCGYKGDGSGSLAVRDRVAIQDAMWGDASLAAEFDKVLPVSRDRQERYSELFSNAETLAMVAPAVYEEIKAMLPDTIMAAKVPGEVQKLLDEGVLRFVADKDGEILPTIFKNNQMYKNVRLEELDLRPDLGNAVINFQQQAALAEILHEVREVHEEIREVKAAMRDDRLARLDAAWYQLQQAARMGDARLREVKLLSISDTVAELRFMLERDFEAGCVFFDERSGSKNFLQLMFDQKGLEQGDQRSREMFETLVALTRAVQVETSAYCLLDEQEAAQASLKQFGAFIASNQLDDKNQLLEISQYNSVDQNDLIEGFAAMQIKISELPSAGTGDEKLLPSEEERGGEDDEAVQG